ncbi:hypothetical protein Tco_0156471 [Tanacetum coccineum]
MLRPGYRWTSNPRGLYVTPVLQEDGRPERPKKEKSKPLLFAGGELKASGGSNRDAKDALSKLLQMGTVAEYDSEAFSLARAMEARFAKEALSKLLQMGTVAQYHNELKLALQIELLRARPTTLAEAFSLAHKGEITSDNDARDQASEVEMKVLVDGKQDDTKVVGVAVEQNNDKPNVLEASTRLKWCPISIQPLIGSYHNETRITYLSAKISKSVCLVFNLLKVIGDGEVAYAHVPYLVIELNDTSILVVMKNNFEAFPNPVGCGTRFSLSKLRGVGMHAFMLAIEYALSNGCFGGVASPAIEENDAGCLGC